MGLTGSRYGPAVLRLRKGPVTHSIGGCVGYMASLEECGKSCLLRDSISASCSSQPVAILSALSHNRLLVMYIVAVRCGEIH
jgi:hypothetical protein